MTTTTGNGLSLGNQSCYGRAIGPNVCGALSLGELSIDHMVSHGQECIDSWMALFVAVELSGHSSIAARFIQWLVDVVDLTDERSILSRNLLAQVRLIVEDTPDRDLNLSGAIHSLLKMALAQIDKTQPSGMRPTGFFTWQLLTQSDMPPAMAQQAH